MIDVGTGSITHTLHQIERLADDPDSEVHRVLSGFLWHGLGSITLLSPTARNWEGVPEYDLIRQSAYDDAGVLVERFGFNPVRGLIEVSKYVSMPVVVEAERVMRVEQSIRPLPLEPEQIRHELDFYNALTEPLRRV